MRFNGRLAIIAALIATIVGTGLAQASPRGPAGDPHLPDLRTLPPTDLRIQNNGTTKQLFFSNHVGNYGEGPLEMHAKNDPATGKTRAFQDIWTHDEAGNTIVLDTILVGTFVFHPAHDHWHFEDFARYDITSVGADGQPGTVLRTATKVSFCIIDTDVVASGLEHFNWGLSHGCGQTSHQGLRVGRGDTYGSYLPDQYVDVTDLPDGKYFLVSTVDPPTVPRPNGRLQESDDLNNARATEIRIKGNRVIVTG